MKAAKTKGAKSWLDGKLSNPQFRRKFEEESQKLAIGEQLMHVRLKAGLTQAQVAKKIGTTASAISRYENADYDRYEIRTLQKIVQACGGHLEIVLEAGPKTHRPPEGVVAQEVFSLPPPIIDRDYL